MNDETVHGSYIHPRCGGVTVMSAATAAAFNLDLKPLVWCEHCEMYLPSREFRWLDGTPLNAQTVGP